MRLVPGETLRVDALRTDGYVEALIAGAAETAATADPGATWNARIVASADSAGAMYPTGAAVFGGAADRVDPDPAIADVARLLHATAWRPHPSFRFEERVARRLAGAAQGCAMAGDDPTGTVVAFPGPVLSLAPGGRPYAQLAGLASAAVASAALSIGAAAVVAWRRGRLRRGIA